MKYIIGFITGYIYFYYGPFQDAVHEKLFTFEIDQWNNKGWFSPYLHARDKLRKKIGMFI